MSVNDVPGNRFEWPSASSGSGLMPGQASPGASGEAPTEGPTADYVTGEAVTAVPDDAVEITADVTVADDTVAVAPDGSVVDTSVEGTVVTTADGVEVTVAADGTVSVDSDFTNAADIEDISSLAVGGSFETESGTVITRNEDGSVTIEQANGQSMTINPDGTVDVDIPDDYDTLGASAGAGDGSGGGGGGEDSGEESGEEGDAAGEGEDAGADDLGGGGGGPSGGGSSGGGGGDDSGAGLGGGLGGGGLGGDVGAGGVDTGIGMPVVDPVTGAGDPWQPGNDPISNPYFPPEPQGSAGVGSDFGGSGSSLPDYGTPVDPGHQTGVGPNGLIHNPVDTDGDGIPDYRDVDSDNDGIPDYIEARPDNPTTPTTPGMPSPGVPTDPGLDLGEPTAPTEPTIPTNPTPGGGGGVPDPGTPIGGGGGTGGGGTGGGTGGGGTGGGTGGGGGCSCGCCGNCNPGDGGGDGGEKQWDLSDIRDDAAYFADLVPMAESIKACWDAAGPLVQHWGLWFAGAGSYKGGCSKFSNLYAGAAREMASISEGLNQNAELYQQQEESNAQTASNING